MEVPSSLSLISDIDECTEETDNCAAIIATCTDTEGSFTCACNSGYRGDGVSCTGMFCSADDYLADDKINHPLMHRYFILSRKPSSG